jgi:hypothetical protein
MSHTVCWKCKRSVEPLERREKDKKARKTWLISYCPFERCNTNLDIQPAPPVKLWTGSYFAEENDPEVDKD